MTTDFAAALSIVLAALLGVAATAKLRRPAALREALRGFGLSTRFTRAVPTAEIAAAALLLVRPRLGGLVATALFAAFTGIVATAVRRRAKVACGCFGSSDTRPVSVVTVARNAGLVTAAAVVATTAPTAFRAPTLAAVVTAGTASAIAAVVMGLANVRTDVGSLFPKAHT